MSGKIVSSDREMDQEALVRRAARAARGLAALGIKAGEGVAIMLRNDFAFFEASIAASMLGAAATPINWHFTGEEMAYIVGDCGSRVLVIHADLWARVRGGMPAGALDGVTILVVETPPAIAAAYGISPADGAVLPDAIDWDAWVDGQEPLDAGLPPMSISMIYTSGTTGRPKGVRRDPPTAESVAAIGGMVERTFGTTPGMRTVMCGPMYHAAPNVYGLMAFRAESTIVLQPRFDPLELMALIEAHRITHVHMVPTMFVRLLKLPGELQQRHDLSSLEFVVHAAAPCPPDIKRAMIDWWGPVINEYYGSTETGAVVFCNSEEWLAHPGTVGQPVPEATVRIYDDDGRERPIGEVGEVYVRLDGLPDFTYQGRDADRRAIERDGLITAGDVGYLDEDGFLYLCDRKNDMVISGGVNIYPAEIEAVLVNHPDVFDCAVFGIPDDEFGEALAAHVQPTAGASPDAHALRAFLSERIAGYKIPKRIEFQAELPREDSGKIFKRKLRDPYWENAGRRI
ncbi:MAG: acyl-CoA synthetase [SAR324 cluster bacterium]|nr:acyl-CoA synthetase [SAR324 cluster bacterium]